LEYLLVGLPAGIIACVGLALFILGLVFGSPMSQFRKAVVRETEAAPIQ
jgi:hypothetical protein